MREDEPGITFFIIFDHMQACKSRNVIHWTQEIVMFTIIHQSSRKNVVLLRSEEQLGGEHLQIAIMRIAHARVTVLSSKTSPIRVCWIAG
jgi:hypothetical protein